MPRVFRHLSLSAFIVVATATPAADTDEALSLDALRLSDQAWALRANSPISNPTTLVVIDGESAVLIDASLLDTAPLIEDWLRSQGVERIRHVATTHFHADHTHGLEYFGATGASVIATPGQRRRLVTEGLISADSPPLRSDALPTLLLSGELSIPLGAETLTLFTTGVERAHTDGDLFARLQRADVIYVGDHFIVDRFPVIDLDGGGSVAGFFENLQRIISLAGADTQIVPGHARFAPLPLAAYDRADLQRWRDRLLATIASIDAMHAAGLSLEAAQARGLPAEFAALSERPRFVRESAWIETIYRSRPAASAPPVQ